MDQIPLGGQALGTHCASLAPPIVPGAEVVKLSAAEVHGFQSPAFPPWQPTEINDLSFCNVTVTLTHPGADDTVYITVWLPLKDWNGRYQATGGGGLAAGFAGIMLMKPTADGYAASSTDAGLTLDNTVDPQRGEWALRPDGTPNDELSLNFAWRSVHDMAIASKDLIKQFYGTPQSYSYWTGCSQGGRQGYTAAGQYPHDFDGILATAPAVEAAHFVPADFWPAVVMQNDEVPPFCVFEEYKEAIITKCDPLDGTEDGLISDHELIDTCPFDPKSLVGKEILCEEECIDLDPETMLQVMVPCSEQEKVTITEKHAEIVSEILRGPTDHEGKRLWFGLALGAGFFATAKTVRTSNGARVPIPFVPAESWIKMMTLQDASYDMSKMTREDYLQAHAMSISRLTELWGNHTMDLTDFSQSGGKLLTWVGLGDEYIPPPGTIRFRENVEKKFGGADVVNEFYRFFLAPGAGHCAGGVGPVPSDPLNALVSWVERGVAPEHLPASTVNPKGVEVTRNLCPFPKKLVHTGGDVNKAESFSCQ